MAKGLLPAARLSLLPALWMALGAVPAAQAISFAGKGMTAALPDRVETVGETSWVTDGERRAVLLRGGSHLRVPTSAWFDGTQGSIAFAVRPEWPRGDSGRHAFVHLGDGNAHVTVFRQGDSHVLFVYKGNPESWRGASLRTGPWSPGSWHQVCATWRTTPGQGIVLFLTVDGITASATGAVPLPVIPEVTFVGCRGEIEPADAALADVDLGNRFRLPDPALSAAATVPMAVDAGAPVGPMPRTWSFVTPWNSRSNPIPFTRDHPYFRRFREAGFEMVRMVAFSESWLWGTRVERGPDGELQLDFRDFDTLLDLYRAAGAEPYVRLAY
ncbi:MAG: hypothetical protein JXR77_11330, partial [Lentisphaeria bacterium]|nr:hypothetical protein [Lentisphaeria bacterium]